MYSARQIILTLSANTTTINSHSLANKKLLKVKMDGDGYNIVYTTTPVGRQVRFRKVVTGGIGSFGRLTFPQSSPTDRSVYVLIKE